MVKPTYQPDRGDFVFMDFTPQAGTEQAGHRPALVLSPLNYNIATGHILAVPITSKDKPSSFDVPVPKGAKIQGFILANQIKDLDWIARNAKFHSKCDTDTLCEVLGRIEAILSIECS